MLYYYQNGFERFERHFATTELDEKLTNYWKCTYFNENSKTELKIHQLSSKKVSVKIISKHFSSSEKTSKTLWLKSFMNKNTIFVSLQVTYENV